MRWTITIEGTDEFGSAHRSELDFAHFWNFLLKSTAYGLASFGANPLKCLSVFSKCAKSS